MEMDENLHLLEAMKIIIIIIILHSARRARAMMIRVSDKHVRRLLAGSEMMDFIAYELVHASSSYAVCCPLVSPLHEYEYETLF